MCHMTEYAAAQTRKYEWFSLIAKTACVAKENKHNSMDQFQINMKIFMVIYWTHKEILMLKN